MGASINRASQVARYVVAQVLTQAAATAQVSAAFGATTRFVSFIAADAGYFLVSAAGTLAAATDHRFGAGERVEAIVHPGEKLSTLLDSDVVTNLSELA